MISENISLNSFIELAKTGKLPYPEFGWVDWFCKDTSLPLKTKKLLPVLNFFKKQLGELADNYILSLCNRCPFYGTLYDSITLVNSEDHSKYLTIVPMNGHENNRVSSLCITTKNGDKEFTAENYSKLKKDILNLDLIKELS